MTTHEVTEADTAVALGSGEVGVLGTPRLLAWLEAATVSAAAGHLAAGQTSVGTQVRLRHRRPSPVGARVDVTARLSRSEGQRLSFAVEALDAEGEVVASGEIDRVAVNRAAFS